ncbi:MAG TPA: flavin reductase family protein [Puia sp.]|jgi:flavin reductase (DIM6/NTAB) family NADH-FMN oxidoreductase RutF|nr:flavin reductase family protein [Puia sp.]
MKNYPVNKVNRIIEPGPIVLVTTFHRGKPNIMTMGFHMMVQHDPALIGAVIGPWDFSHKAIKATRECVIAIPGSDLAVKVVDIGNCSGEEIDKFKKFRLTPKEAQHVKAPLIEQCIANIECKVVDTRLVKKYNLFILKVVKVWLNTDRKEQRTMHHQGDGSFKVDGKTIDLSKRMVKWRELAD